MTDILLKNEVVKVVLSEEEKQSIFNLATVDGGKDKNINIVLNNVFSRLNFSIQQVEVEKQKNVLLESLKQVEKSYKNEYEKARKLGVTSRYFQQASVGKVLSTVLGYIDCEFHSSYGLNNDGFKKFLEESKLTACMMKNRVYEFYNSIQAVEEEESESTSEESTGEEESKTSKSEVEKTLEKFLSYLKSFKKLDSVEKVKFSLLVKEEVKKINEKENLENRGISKKEG